MCMGIIIVAPIFVPWFFGDEFVKATPILQILSMLFIFSGINSITGTQYLISTNQTNKHIVMLIIGGAVNIVLNLIFIPILNAKGAAIGSLLGEVVISVLEIGYLHITKQYNFFNIIKHSYKFFISIIIMSAIGFLITNHMQNNFVTMIVAVIACSATYIITLVILKEKFVLDEINAILKRIKKQ